MKNIVIFGVFFLFFICTRAFGYAGSCSFVGENTSIALQHTQELIENIKKLRDNANCKIGDQTLNSLTNVSKYLDLYQNSRNPEQTLIGIKAQTEQLQIAYKNASTPEEKSYWMDKLIASRTDQIVTNAQISVGRGQTQDTLLNYSLNDVAAQIGVVIQSAATLNDCFISKPELASLVLSGLVNVTGSVASVATVNPIWGGVGSIVGNLITTLTTYITRYKWDKYIKVLDKKIIYHSTMCMIEMEANFYCEKTDEIDVVKKIMRDLELGSSAPQGDSLWKGIDIQANSVPVIQNWIKVLHKGLPPTSGSDAQDQNELLLKVSSAEMIQNQIMGYYKKVEEQFNDGSGEKLNIIMNSVSDISAMMGGTTTSGDVMGQGGNGGGMSMMIGQVYYTNRFLKALIPYILLTPPSGDNYENYPKMPPQCPGGGYCDKMVLFIDYLKQQYGANDQFSSEILAKMLSVLSKRIEYIFAKVNIDIDNDLARQRIRDPEVLLSKAKNADFPYKLSPEKSFVKVKGYLVETIEILKRYLNYPENQDPCLSKNLTKLAPHRISIRSYLGLEPKKGTTPVELALTCETKRLVEDVLRNLNDNEANPRDRIINISRLLRFSTDRTLYFMARMGEILKTDLNARVELGLLTPSEQEMSILQEKDVMVKLASEQNTININFNQAVKERESAQTVVRDNLSVILQLSPIRERLVSVTDEWRSNDSPEYKSKYGEGCAILLALPFTTNKQDIRKVCSQAYAESEWNTIRSELNLPIIPELDVKFQDVFQQTPYPKRMCTYREYLRKNVIYGIKKRYQRE